MKKTTLVQNITYMALMAAINVVFVLLTTFIPVLLFLIVFVLPLTSVIVTLHCQKRYFPIYAFATVGLCMIVTIWKIDDTIFYVIPSLISGFVFGLFVEKRFPSFWIIVATTIIQIAFTYVSIPIISFVLGNDIVTTFATAFGIKDFKYLNYVTPCFIFFISLVQEIFAYMVIREELPKFGYTLNEPKYLPISLVTSIAVGVGLSILFTFVFGPLSYLFTLFTMLLGIYALLYLLLEKKTILYALLGASLLIFIFLFALLYPLVKEPLGLVLINIFFFLEAIIVLTNNYLLISKDKNTIK